MVCVTVIGSVSAAALASTVAVLLGVECVSVAPPISSDLLGKAASTNVWADVSDASLLSDTGISKFNCNSD